jgi:hypothetical protein
MGKTQQINRRKYPRVQADAVMGIHAVEGGTQLAHTVDLGIGGIRFQCPGQELGLGDVIEVTFTVEGHSATVAGKVIRVSELDLAAQEVALAFLDVDAETLQRLHELGLEEDTEKPEA